jgi:hypothetical protein
MHSVHYRVSPFDTVANLSNRLIHLVLFVLRFIVIRQTRSGSRTRSAPGQSRFSNIFQVPWRFPHGQLSVEFRIRLLRDPEPGAEANVATDGEANPEANPESEAPVASQAAA